MKSKSRKWLTLGMTLVMAVAGTACSTEKGAKQKENDAKSQTVAEMKEQDLDETILAVENEEVSLHEFLFYVYCLKSNYDAALTADVWNYEYEDGKQIGTYAKESIAEEIAQIKIIGQEAKKQGVALTEEEENEANVQAGQFMENLPEDAKVYQFTRELVANIYKEHALAKKMYDVVGGTIDTTVSDDEAKLVKTAYIKVLTEGTDRNGNKVELTDTEKKKAYSRAEKLKENWKNAEDPLAYAESNSDIATYEMDIHPDTEPEELVNPALALSDSEVSDVITTDDGYYVLYCEEAYDSGKVTEYKEEILADREKEAFKEAFQGWKKDYKIVVSKPLLESLSLDEGR